MSQSEKVFKFFNFKILKLFVLQLKSGLKIFWPRVGVVFLLY